MLNNPFDGADLQALGEVIETKLNQIWNYSFSTVKLATPIPPVELTSDNVALEWGVYSSNIIAADEIAEGFVIVAGAVANPDDNGNYYIEFYYGAEDTPCTSFGFTKTNPFQASLWRPLKTEIIPANSRVRARLRHSAGNEATCLVGVYYQTV